MKRLPNSAVLVIVFGMVGYVLNYLLNVFFARHLTQSLYGDFALARQCLGFAAIIALLGSPVTAQRIMPLLDKESTNRFIQWNFAYILKPLILLMLALICAYGVMFALHVSQIYSFNQYHTVLVLLAFTPILSFLLVIAAYLRADRYMIESTILSDIFRPSAIGLVACSVVFFLEKELDNFSLFSIYIIAYMALIVVTILFYKATSGLNILKHIRPQSNNNNLTKESEWKNYSQKALLSALAFELMRFLDMLIIEFFPQYEHLLGQFAVCCIITGVMGPIIGLYFFVVQPRVSKYIQTIEGRRKLQKAYNKSFLLALALDLILAICIVVFRVQVLSHFGPSYRAASNVLLILTLNAVLQFLGIGPAKFLIFSGYAKFLLMVNLISLVVLLILGVVLTYFFSITGTAIADVLVSLGIFLVKSVYCRYRLKLKSLVWL